mmetsp:Transcript_74315/g.174451  ORF Transcript_74315/g.174451 Transcript_74315/m.174451 type:complete len:329 (-) Transcript_74315:325-1311(-)
MASRSAGTTRTSQSPTSTPAYSCSRDTWSGSGVAAALPLTTPSRVRRTCSMARACFSCQDVSLAAESPPSRSCLLVSLGTNNAMSSPVVPSLVPSRPDRTSENVVRRGSGSLSPVQLKRRMRVAEALTGLGPPAPNRGDSPRLNSGGATGVSSKGLSRGERRMAVACTSRGDALPNHRAAASADSCVCAPSRKSVVPSQHAFAALAESSRVSHCCPNHKGWHLPGHCVLPRAETQMGDMRSVGTDGTPGWTSLLCADTGTHVGGWRRVACSVQISRSLVHSGAVRHGWGSGHIATKAFAMATASAALSRWKSPCMWGNSTLRVGRSRW